MTLWGSEEVEVELGQGGLVPRSRRFIHTVLATMYI